MTLERQWHGGYVQPCGKDRYCHRGGDGDWASHRNPAGRRGSDRSGSGCELTRSAASSGRSAQRSVCPGADVADVASVKPAVDQVLQRTGQIDILVNNAGIAGPAAYIWEQTDENWQRNIAINLTGVFNFCRAVVPHNAQPIVWPHRERGLHRGQGRQIPG